MPIKKLIRVASPEPHQYTRLVTRLGSTCWGHVDITTNHMPSGPIYFQYGRADAVGEGWGLKHIWKKRHRHHATHGDALVAIEPLVLAVLRSGTGVWFEEQGKVAAVSSKDGTVILNLHDGRAHLGDLNDWYSITTFFHGTNAHGVRVGSIR